MIGVLMTAIAAGLVCSGSGWGQSGPATSAAGGSTNSSLSELETAPNASTDSIRSEIELLVHDLHQTQDAAAKADLLKRLETAVSKLFDEDLKMREAQLSQLEERVTKLRGQLERWRKSKAEITELQTKTLAIDAEALGLTGPPFGNVQQFGLAMPFGDYASSYYGFPPAPYSHGALPTEPAPASEPPTEVAPVSEPPTAGAPGSPQIP